MERHLNRVIGNLVLSVMLSACANLQASGPKSSLDELADSWWRWAVSFRDDESQVTDPTGERCAAGQSGQIWYLAGSYTSSKTRRTCKVPGGMSLFFPLINFEDDESGLTCEEHRAKASTRASHVSRVEFVLDGKQQDVGTSNHVQSRSCFDVVDGNTGEPLTGAADGYWIFLPPLPPGKHHLQLRAETTEAGGFGQDVEYDLLVGG
jgi:hypothetical protein